MSAQEADTPYKFWYDLPEYNRTALKLATAQMRSVVAYSSVLAKYHQEFMQPFWTALEAFLSTEQKKLLRHPTALLYLQSKQLRELKEKGYLWEFSFLELENLVSEFFELQGKSERIKNFPYPRQYATLSYYFVWIFILLLPFATIPLFGNFGGQLAGSFPVLSKYFVWTAIPFCVLVSWVFHTMERIGRVGEMPFEGSANDVPISTIARGIEIDLRQMLDEDNEHIPKQFPEEYDVQM